MTKRDFFILIIKIFGLYLVITNLFSFLPSNISLVLMGIDAFSMIWIALVAFSLIGLFILLLFKADKVVNLLKLDKGFDDDRIDLGNLKSTDIIKISIFIIGGMLIIHNIPRFLNHTLFAFKGDVIGVEYDLKDKFNWILSGINLIIGYLLLTNFEFISRLFKVEKKDEETTTR